MNRVNALPNTPQSGSGIPEATARRGGGHLLVAMIPVGLAAAWGASTSGLYTAGSGVGYWLGVAGGTMMVLLFLYPLRKRITAMRALGRTKYWFALHMLLGVAGPLLILAHSTFRIGSINAGVALTCMLLVAGSGVAGRYIYTRLHHGLYGERARARELQAELSERLQRVSPLLQHLPQVKDMLASFEARALQPQPSWPMAIWNFVTFSLRAHITQARCERALDRLHERDGLHAGAAQRRHDLEHDLLTEYFSSLQRVAQLGTWERLFSWWHILHVPLVYMLVLSAIAHVVAVHIY